VVKGGQAYNAKRKQQEHSQRIGFKIFKLNGVQVPVFVNGHYPKQYGIAAKQQIVYH
jgi:hypothetical protein